MQSILTPSQVQHQAAALLRTQLRLQDYGICCPVSTLLAVVFTACCRLCSLFAATRRLLGAPSHETVRQALRFNLPDRDELEARLNRALVADVPKALARRRQRLAIDLILIPYHGQPESDGELYRGQAKSGTTHFHAYATAYLSRHGQRFTLALTVVRQGEKLEKVLQRLLRRCAHVGVRPRLLLLDRGFWTVGVIRYLQAARHPFLMPVIARGRKATAPGGPSGTRVFWGYRRSGWGTYTLQETGGGRKATVSVCVHVRNRAGRRGKHGREHLVYAYWGWQPSAPAALSALYRQRFGIESSYRQLHEARAKTCTRSPVVRLFLVGVALVLRNVWVWLHHEVLSSPRRGRRRYRWERLRFKDLLLWLLHEAERVLGTWDEVVTERPIPIELNPTGPPVAG
jgi:Transposase DDE domain